MDGVELHKTGSGSGSGDGEHFQGAGLDLDVGGVDDARSSPQLSLRGPSS